MSDPNAFSVTQLKEVLRTRALSTTGNKNELIARLMEADPSGEWMREHGEDGLRDGCPGEDGREDSLCRRELEICRREKEIAERELELARREIAVLRERQDVDRVVPGQREEASAGGGGGATAVSHPRSSLMAIADLLADFDGSGDFNTWEKQVRLLKTTYRLNDEYAKILIGMRPKKKALEWFHSKPEFISMSFDGLVGELRMMFGYRQNKVVIRKNFETRIWKRDETFREYVHEKLILGNRVPIGADEIVHYVIDGIPDNVLCNQARMQQFVTTESLLRASKQ